MTPRFAYAIAAAALIAPVAVVHAQDPVKWTATPTSKTAAPGAQVGVKLAATIEDGWHIYSITQGPGGPTPTRISAPTGQPFTIDGKIKASAPDTKFDENFGIQVETYENTADFTVPLKVDPTAKAGAQAAQIAVRYQVCNASTCLPAKTEKVSVPLSVGKGKSGK